MTTRTVAQDSRSVAFWTLLSRLSGFVRVGAVAAVLGPTFFGNLFQIAILVPYVLSQLLAGSLIPSLLTPRLVQLIDRGEREAADRLAGGFLRVLVTIFAATALAGALLSPWIVQALTLATQDPTVRARQIALGVPLLLTLLPQLVFDGMAAIGIAAQFARRRFAFATAAPILENLGTVAVLATSAAAFGIGREVDEITLANVLLLGLGTTVAAALHAMAQLWAAGRTGVRLGGWASWKSRDVMPTVMMALASSGTAGLNALAWLLLVAAAGLAPGGAIAFQIGLHLFNLPIALAAQPVATAQLPRLASQAGEAGWAAFQSTLRECTHLVVFMVLPAACLFLAIPGVLARAVAVGGMSGGEGVSLIAWAITGLAVGVVGEAVATMAASASYARLDATSPLLAAVIRVSICIIGISLARSLDHTANAMLVLGITGSAAAWAGGSYLMWRVTRDSTESPWPSRAGVFRHLTCALFAVAPAAGIAAMLPTSGQFARDVVLAAALVALTGGIYVAVHFAHGSAELKTILGLAGSRQGVKKP